MPHSLVRKTRPQCRRTLQLKTLCHPIEPKAPKETVYCRILGSKIIKGACDLELRTRPVG